MNTLNHSIIRTRITYPQIIEKLEGSDIFKEILKNLTLTINANGIGSSIAEKGGTKITNFKLESIYRKTKKILGTNLSYSDFIDILRDLIFENLDDETKELLENEEIYRTRGTSFLNGNEENLREILLNLENDYLRYETVCEILKDNFNLDISTKDTRLAKFLNDLGYRKIRKRIEGKQQNVWVK